jgi:hypothetical protein
VFGKRAPTGMLEYMESLGIITLERGWITLDPDLCEAKFEELFQTKLPVINIVSHIKDVTFQGAVKKISSHHPQSVLVRSKGSFSDKLFVVEKEKRNAHKFRQGDLVEFNLEYVKNAYQAFNMGLAK